MTHINKGIQKASITSRDYKAYIEYMRNRGYGREQICIDETYTDIITTKSLAKGCTGTVIDIRCPSRYKMAVIGSSQLSEEDDEDNVSSLMIRLANTTGIEIDPDVRIKIIKEKVSQAVNLVDTMFYKDISSKEYIKTPKINTKPFSIQYKFSRGIEINGDEHLKIDVITPNIDIDCNNVKLFLSIDLWEQE